MWAAFSPASGDTQLLNDEAAAILEVLAESPLTPRTPREVSRVLASDSNVPLTTVEDRLQGSFSLLTAAGLIEESSPEHSGG